jgi:hypothetical protein
VTDTIAPQSSTPGAPRTLLSRAVGVIVSPRATYADVAAHPRVLGALALAVAIIGLATFMFLSTTVGREAALDQQLSTMDQFGFHPTDQQLERIEAAAGRSRYFALAGQAVVIPLASLALAAIALAVFNAALGGNATFRQVYAVVAHSWFLPALQTLFVLPLNYARASMSSSTSLAVFLPMLDDASFAGRLLGGIDLFRIWWLVSLAIGLGVLYKRRTTPIAWTLIAVYVVVVLILAGAATALSGA